ncbi:MAG: ATP-grasp fold amidoligase family protein [Prevotella sp.]|nr:ATP-grasp fold amidoligase family protein [Prevotella sp.]
MKFLNRIISNPLWPFAALWRRNAKIIKNDVLYLKILYFLEMKGKILHIKNPKTFTEKLQWLKLYAYKPEYSQMVDKAAVKSYVRERIGAEYIIPTIATWDKADDIDWNILPQKFVLKTIHGGGGNGIVICTDKNSFNKEAAISKLKKWMPFNAGYAYREFPYIYAKKGIIAETFLEPDNADGDLKDYKFFCFNGKVRCFKIDFGRFTEHHANYYDINGNILPFGEKGLEPDFYHEEKIPSNLSEMIDIAEKLSAGHPFLRVDLYNVSEKIYFGETTFYPAGGVGAFTPREWDLTLGDWLELPHINLQSL